MQTAKKLRFSPKNTTRTRAKVNREGGKEEEEASRVSGNVFLSGERQRGKFIMPLLLCQKKKSMKVFFGMAGLPVLVEKWTRQTYEKEAVPPFKIQQ